MKTTRWAVASAATQGAHANSSPIHIENILKPTVWAESLFVFTF